MTIEMLVDSTGEYQAKVSGLVHAFLEQEQDTIERLSKGEELRQKQVFKNGFERYDCTFCYRKAGVLGLNRLEVFINGVFTAVVKC